MPKLGLKCFLGSFMLSLAAVFAVTKAYFVMSMQEQKQAQELLENIPTKNIELFAANEETDPLYEKFNALNQHHELPVADNSDMAVYEENSVGSESDVLYTPEPAESQGSLVAEPQNLENVEFAENVFDEYVAENTTEDDFNAEELQIADASVAPSFVIPLVHNYKTENGTITISDTANENQVAFAAAGMNIDNLGTNNAAAVTEPLLSNEKLIGESGFTAGLAAPQMEADSPWEMAGTANRHVTKNSLELYAAKHQAEIVAPDEAPQPEPVEEYKMQQNILIPIPEDIMNERNLTPQFSTSEENLRLERELRAKHQLPALPNEQNVEGSNDNYQPVKVDDDEKDFDEEDEDDNNEETSKSLSDSIAEWFSGSKSKTSEKSAKPAKAKTKAKAKKNSAKNDGSIFNKLLGIGGQDDNIVPSELKLSFQPNRAEISGQTLEWLHAFSDNSVKNEDVFIEIRIDKTAPYALQEKRLKLLYKILANNGVDYHKINIIFTDREPNSFIIRNIKYASDDDKIKAMKRADNPWY